MFSVKGTVRGVVFCVLDPYTDKWEFVLDEDTNI